MLLIVFKLYMKILLVLFTIIIKQTSFQQLKKYTIFDNQHISINKLTTVIKQILVMVNRTNVLFLLFIKVYFLTLFY